MVNNSVLNEKHKIQEEISLITKGKLENYKKIIQENQKELLKKYNFDFKKRSK